MRGINKVQLIGHLGADPEVRYTPSGDAVASISLATSENWTDKAGERHEKTEWHRLVLWRKLAEIAGQYLRKGSRVYVEGKLQTRTWEDQAGQKRSVVEIVVHELVMLDGRPESQQEGQRVQQAQPEPVNAGRDDDFDLPF